MTGVSFKNNAVYLVWIGPSAKAAAAISGFIPTLSTHTPGTDGEILGAFKYRSGIIPGIKLTAASRFYNLDGMGMSKAGTLVASPGQFASAAVPSNPTIAAQKNGEDEW